MLHFTYFVSSICFKRLRVFLTASKSDFGHFWAIWTLFGSPLAKIGVTPELPVGLKIPTFMFCTSFQLRSTLFQPFRTSRALKVGFGLFLGNLGPFWAPWGQNWGHSRTSNWSENPNIYVPYLVPTLFHAVPTVSNLQSPQSRILAVLGQFGPFFGQFWALEVLKVVPEAGTPWNEA